MRKPSTGTPRDFYLSRKKKLLRNFDKTAKCIRGALEARFGDDADMLIKEIRREYEALIPDLPYIGGYKNLMYTLMIIASARHLAVYRTMTKRGVAAEEFGSIVFEIEEEIIASLSAFTRLLLRIFFRLGFTGFGRRMLKKWAAESQRRRYPGDWVFAHVPGDGDAFDYGLDYTECVVCKFFRAHDAAEAAPYLCPADFAWTGSCAGDFSGPPPSPKASTAATSGSRRGG